ncbi:hypothetical protein KP778_11410 [Streptococcus equi subsp. zooepidemicus]|nr:hypothetical protein [Streptococcus equi]MCD3464384.1 hypothetical protein [Streptococcus equi subsp. zooepidemicus]
MDDEFLGLGAKHFSESLKETEVEIEQDNIVISAIIIIDAQYEDKKYSH